MAQPYCILSGWRRKIILIVFDIQADFFHLTKKLPGDIIVM